MQKRINYVIKRAETPKKYLEYHLIAAKALLLRSLTFKRNRKPKFPVSYEVHKALHYNPRPCGAGLIFKKNPGYRNTPDS